MKGLVIGIILMLPFLLSAQDQTVEVAYIPKEPYVPTKKSIVKKPTVTISDGILYIDEVYSENGIAVEILQNGETVFSDISFQNYFILPSLAENEIYTLYIHIGSNSWVGTFTN